MKHSKKIIETTLSLDKAGSEKTANARTNQRTAGRVSKKRETDDSRLEKNRDVREEEGQYDDGSYPWWVEYFGIDKSFFHDDWEEEALEENEDSVADSSKAKDKEQQQSYEAQ